MARPKGTGLIQQRVLEYLADGAVKRKHDVTVDVHFKRSAYDDVKNPRGGKNTFVHRSGIYRTISALIARGEIIESLDVRGEKMLQLASAAKQNDVSDLV